MKRLPMPWAFMRMRRVAAVVLVTGLTASGGRLVAQVTPPSGYVFSTIAGQTSKPVSVDGTGAAARFARPGGVAVGPSGDIFVIDTLDQVVRRVTPAGVVETWAGQHGVTGTANGPRQTASFSDLRSVAVTPDGSVLVADGQVIRRIDTNGRVTTAAGVEGTQGSSDGVGTAARLQWPGGLSAAPDGSVYFIDRGVGRVRRLAPDGTVSTILAPGTLSGIAAVAAAPEGHLVVLTGTELVQVTTSGAIASRRATGLTGVSSYGSLVAAPGGALFVSADASIHRVDVSPAQVVVSGAGAEFFPVALAPAPDGSLVFASSLTGLVRRVQPDGSGLSTLAGRYLEPPDVVVDGAAGVARFVGIDAVAAAADGTIYVADNRTAIRAVAADGTVSTLAGSPTGNGSVDGTGSAARFMWPRSLVILPGGDLAVFDADGTSGAVRRVTPAGVVTTISTQAAGGLAVDALGRIAVADTFRYRIARIELDGSITTIAGSGADGTADGPAASATFRRPSHVLVAPDGTMYVTDSDGQSLRAISTAGEVTTLAGRGGTAGYVDGTGDSVRFLTAGSLVWEGDGRLLVADQNNCRIRRVTTAGVVTTIAGRDCDRSAGSAQSKDGHATVAQFENRFTLASGPGSTLVVGDGRALRRGVPEADIAPVVITDPASVTALAGQAAQFTVSASTGATLQWQQSIDQGVTWTPLSDGGVYSGATTSTLDVSSTSLSLDGILYRAVATNSRGSAASRPARLTVGALVSRPGALRFSVTTAGSLGPIVAVTAPQTLTVATGAPSASWTVASDRPWLQLSRTSGSGAAVVTASIIDPGSPLGGVIDRTAVVTFTPAGGGAVVYVPVTLQAYTTEQTIAPWGFMDTPANNATSRGSIAVTGWAMDDVGIAHVRVYRWCLTAEPQVNCQELHGRSLVFIGEAARVPGARFEGGRNYPEERSGGWGYLLLTNMLPRITPFQPYGGVGHVTLTVVATDLEGHSTVIGERGQVLDNDTIAKPFGAIDTPGQGQTVSGTLPIFGWALSPDDGTGIVIPIDGSSMVVYIDGLPVSLVTFNQCRGTVPGLLAPGVFCDDDVANVFGTTTPQAPLTARTSNPSVYRNLDAGRGAIGSYVLNTAGMTNGLHSLAWSVTDSLGRVEGIGSRNFEVLNAGADEATAGGLAFRPGVASTRGVFAGAGPVWVREGFDTAAEWTLLAPGADGVLRTEVTVPGRVQLWVGGPIDAASLMVDGVAQPLPAGASLEGGVLTWAPASGYLGDYQFSVVRGTRRIDIVISVW